MKRLEVSYLGLKLKNPIIVSSSGLTATVERIVALEKAGAGAVVLKSMFQEQIDMEMTSHTYYSDYPEAADYVGEYIRENSINNHLELIAGAKKECTIPIIASVNCVEKGEWVEFAKRIEAAGADAIELNVYMLPLNDSGSISLEKSYLDTVERVCKSVKIPVSVKIGNNFTNIPAMIREIYYRGAKGVVMFNRFYEPDIDLDEMKMITAPIYSDQIEIRNVLRWMAISSAYLPDVDYAASTGIHNGESAVKVMLAGATGVQICSAIYQDGEKVIGEMLDYIKEWMGKHSYVNASDFIGAMNYSHITNPTAYERAQFMKYFSRHQH